MQTTGYIISNTKKIKVLYRPNFKRNTVSLKLRNTGNDGNRLGDEEVFLRDNPEIMERLLLGKTIEI